jgi:hypothetical protein
MAIWRRDRSVTEPRDSSPGLEVTGKMDSRIAEKTEISLSGDF